jgi:aspartyl-tRNA synthetase
MLSIYRDIYIKDTIQKNGSFIKLSGWVSRIRDHGGIIFLDLRDSSGVIQVTYDGQIDFSTESIVTAEGTIVHRQSDQINTNLITGSIELKAKKITLISKSAPLPIEVNNESIAEDLQLKYRTLYLRGEKMHHNLLFRAQIIKFIRNYMNNYDFLEVQTPIITSSSPEGARDFVIPSRLHPGKFYALPQAPQIFKQLLMASGYDKYFQIAPCFRDEDARKDRCYGEFYQLDCEMSFVERDQILDFIIKLLIAIIKEFTQKQANTHRITYHDSLEKYGTDKPDLRIPLIIEDFSELFRNSEMELFKSQILKGKSVKGFRINRNFGQIELNNSLCKSILDVLDKEHNFKVAYIIKNDNEIKGPIAKFIPNSFIDEGEAVFFVCDEGHVLLKKLDILRLYLAKALDFYLDPMQFELVEVIDFPMFEEDESSSTGWAFTHNPFSKPKNLSENLNNLSQVVANQYDIVLNGFEIISGSIRNTDVENLIQCFGIVGRDEAEVREKFNSIISGFAYAVPPHGGFALGIERLIMILLNEENVRKVVAFPLNTNGTDPFTRTPNEISNQAKKELHLK